MGQKGRKELGKNDRRREKGEAPTEKKGPRTGGKGRGDGGCEDARKDGTTPIERGQGGARVSSKTLAIATIVLVAALLFVAALLYDKPDVPVNSEDWWVAVSGDVDRPQNFTMDEFRELPWVEESLMLKGTGEDGKPHLYRGVALHELLDLCEANESARTVRVWAVDQYQRSFSLDSIQDRDDVLLAYSMDGEPIPGREDGGNGPIRLIVSQDHAGDEYNAQHCVKYVYKVTVE